MAILLFGDDVLECRVYCYDDDSKQLAINVYHYQVVEPAGDPTLEVMVKRYSEIVAPLYKAWLTDNSRYRGVTMRRVSPNPTPALSSTEDQGFGTIDAGQAPLNGAAVISRFTETPGPSGRGRVFLPFIAVTNLTTNGQLSGGGEVLALAIGNGLTVNDYTWVGDDASELTVQSVLYGPPEAPVTKGINRIHVQDRIATQRRRGDYGRLNQPPF